MLGDEIPKDVHGNEKGTEPENRNASKNALVQQLRFGILICGTRNAGAMVYGSRFKPWFTVHGLRSRGN